MALRLPSRAFRHRDVQATHYGHVAKHLEVGHLLGLPVVQVDARTRLAITKKIQRIAQNRNRAKNSWPKRTHCLHPPFGCTRGDQDARRTRSYVSPTCRRDVNAWKDRSTPREYRR